MIIDKQRILLPVHILPGAIFEGYMARFGMYPDEDVVFTAMAHIVHEHGRENGKLKLFYNYNFGNMDVVAPVAELIRREALYFMREEVEGDLTTGVDLWRGKHFRQAHPSTREGMIAYWSRLFGGYNGAFCVMHDPEQFARALKRLHYYTGNEEAYVASLVSMKAEFVKKYGETADSDAWDGGL